MYDHKRFDLQFRGKDVQIWHKGSLASLLRVATIHGVAFDFKEAGFKDGNTVELTIKKAPKKGKKIRSVQELIQKLEEGLSVPGTSIGRSLISLEILEGVIPLTDEDRQRGHVLGWGVAVSDMAVGVGQTYYHRTIEGALELALKDKRGCNGSEEDIEEEEDGEDED